MSKPLGPNGYPLCKAGHERTPGNVDKKRTCKECSKISKQQNYKANKETIKEKHRIYYEENKNKFKEYDRQYRESNKDSLKIYRQQYQKANRDRIKKQVAGYQKNNLLVFRLAKHKRRSRENSAGGTLSKNIADILIDLQKNKCRICKTELTRSKFHLDHIHPISKGGMNIDSNIQLLCPTCNLKKGSKLPHIYAQELGMLFL